MVECFSLYDYFYSRARSFLCVCVYLFVVVIVVVVLTIVVEFNIHTHDRHDFDRKRRIFVSRCRVIFFPLLLLVFLLLLVVCRFSSERALWFSTPRQRKRVSSYFCIRYVLYVEFVQRDYTRFVGIFMFYFYFSLVWLARITEPPRTGLYETELTHDKERLTHSHCWGIAATDTSSSRRAQSVADLTVR